MKILKSAIYRITAGTGCGCTVMREYEDADYKMPVGVGALLDKATFTPCKKHVGKPGVEIIEMILSELVEKEALDHKPAPAANAPRPGAAAVVNEAGDLEQRTPINVHSSSRVAVRASGTATASGARRPTTRTGPVAAPRPTQSTPKAAAVSGLSAALAEDDIEDDILAQNDPERAY